jgi:predicted Rossmann fold flavoprotein
MNVAVIGGGAAGFFSAINVKINYPNSHVVIFEKTKKVLTKVKVSGGGRCNVTNGTKSISELYKAYPRGGGKLKKIFEIFSTEDTFNWFESRKVPLYIQDDNRVFPKSNNSQTIIDCLLNDVEKLKIKLVLGLKVQKIKVVENQLKLIFENNIPNKNFDKIIIATGGSPKTEGLNWLKELNHTIEPPVPSLFTFNNPKNPITKLMGLVAENTLVSIQGTKLKSEGPLLITHWGFSGPAVLKTSAFGARILSQKNYLFNIQINWINEANNDKIATQLKNIIKVSPQKKLINIKPFELPERLWNYIIEKSNLPADKKWGELGKKGLNKLINLISNDIYQIKGKTTFKEEFVTCGGISLEDINLKTMESKKCKNLFFAGEIMDIDAITGGYNFQAAWSTGFIAGKLISDL